MCLSERFREILAPHSKALRGTFPMLYIAVTKICDLCMKTQCIQVMFSFQKFSRFFVISNFWTYAWSIKYSLKNN